MPKKYKINKKGAWAKQKSLDVTTQQKVHEKQNEILFFFCFLNLFYRKKRNQKQNEVKGCKAKGERGQEEPQRRVRGATERVNHLKNWKRKLYNEIGARSLICHKMLPSK